MMNKVALEMCSRCVRAWFAAALCTVCLAGCGSAVNRGAEFYAHGRYIDAAQVFEHTEGSLQSYSEAERARYGLYRGATLLALGYANDARHWFNYGSALAQHSLEEGERSALFDALLPAHVRPGSASTPEPAFGTKAASVRVATRHPPPEAPAVQQSTRPPPTLVTP
jgi:hypothetical protein